ncbi:hypothetical protein DRQ23_02445 [bacterium]|nr:MAG: hypothetical protein DRQ23_02445 [bacterium]
MLLLIYCLLDGNTILLLQDMRTPWELLENAPDTANPLFEPDSVLKLLKETRIFENIVKLSDTLLRKCKGIEGEKNLLKFIKKKTEGNYFLHLSITKYRWSSRLVRMGFYVRFYSLDSFAPILKDSLLFTSTTIEAAMKEFKRQIKKMFSLDSFPVDTLDILNHLYMHPEAITKKQFAYLKDLNKQYYIFTFFSTLSLLLAMPSPSENQEEVLKIYLAPLAFGQYPLIAVFDENKGHCIGFFGLYALNVSMIPITQFSEEYASKYKNDPLTQDCCFFSCWASLAFVSGLSGMGIGWKVKSYEIKDGITYPRTTSGAIIGITPPFTRRESIFSEGFLLLRTGAFYTKLHILYTENHPFTSLPELVIATGLGIFTPLKRVLLGINVSLNSSQVDDRYLYFFSGGPQVFYRVANVHRIKIYISIGDNIPFTSKGITLNYLKKGFCAGLGFGFSMPGMKLF